QSARPARQARRPLSRVLPQPRDIANPAEPARAGGATADQRGPPRGLGVHPPPPRGPPRQADTPARAPEPSHPSPWPPIAPRQQISSFSAEAQPVPGVNLISTRVP